MTVELSGFYFTPSVLTIQKANRVVHENLKPAHIIDDVIRLFSIPIKLFFQLLFKSSSS